jgi:2-polyprenyl-3-methyl-5-hydroxy-6-metoxy-1,4-benzoquinol methylase
LPSQDTARFWDRHAEGYAKKPIADEAAYQRKLAITQASLRPTDALLDVGCGTGSLAIELAPLVAQVHALDLSAEMVRIGEAKAAAAGLDNVTFHCGSAEGVAELTPGRFDVVTAYNILHLVTDLDEVLAQLHAWLAPGGTFVSSTVCLRDSWIPYGPLLWMMHKLDKAPPVLNLRAKTVLDAMRRVGFEDVRAEPVTDDRRILFALARKRA